MGFHEIPKCSLIFCMLPSPSIGFPAFFLWLWTFTILSYLILSYLILIFILSHFSNLPLSAGLWWLDIVAICTNIWEVILRCNIGFKDDDLIEGVEQSIVETLRWVERKTRERWRHILDSESWFQPIWFWTFPWEGTKPMKRCIPSSQRRRFTGFLLLSVMTSQCLNGRLIEWLTLCCLE